MGCSLKCVRCYYTPACDVSVTWTSLVLHDLCRFDSEWPCLLVSAGCEGLYTSDSNGSLCCNKRPHTGCWLASTNLTGMSLGGLPSERTLFTYEFGKGKKEYNRPMAENGSQAELEAPICVVEILPISWRVGRGRSCHPSNSHHNFHRFSW